MNEIKHYLTCPICGGTAFERLFVDGPPEFLASRCTACNLGIEHTLRFKTDAYGPGYDAQRDHGVGSDRWRRFHHDRAVAEARLHQLTPIVGAADNRLWVDIGCNNGAFLVAARSAGWRVQGVEASMDVADTLRSTLGLDVTSYAGWTSNDNIIRKAAQSTVFSLYDVLEHLLDPIGALLRIDQLSSGRDYIIIEVPDLDSAVPGKPWRHRRVSSGFTEHIWHFSAQALKALFTKFLPSFSLVSTASPVSTKLQMVWKKRHFQDPLPARESIAGMPYVPPIDSSVTIQYSDAATMISETIADVEKVASLVEGLPSAERNDAVAAIKQTNSTFACLVQERLDRINKKAQGD